MWTWRRPIRLIPARAGKTCQSPVKIPSMMAHPRSRGENAALTAGTGMKVGSSPLARGKPSERVSGLPLRRLIPARAGKTSAYACGDTPPTGSSPLARGKLQASSTNRLTRRLIPARAGKTSPGPAVIRPGGAHPRSRGENDVGDGVHCLVSGSSPLARGKRPRRPGGLPRTRLIPARAGKTRIRSSPRSLSAAHPRSRGENDTLKQAGQQAEGSSPLARGKRNRRRERRLTRRLIPARAGKTPPDSLGRAPVGAHPRSRGEN